MEFTQKDLTEQPYIYVDKECPYGPAIAETMGAGFGEVFGFVAEHGITPQGMPMSIYLGMDPEILRFRAAVAVSAEDAAKAAGTVKSDTLPGGPIMTGTHVGPYDTLNETHQAMWKHMEDAGLAAEMPVWEHYIDDPGNTAPGALRTEIYRKIG